MNEYRSRVKRYIGGMFRVLALTITRKYVHSSGHISGLEARDSNVDFRVELGA